MSDEISYNIWRMEMKLKLRMMELSNLPRLMALEDARALVKTKQED